MEIEFRRSLVRSEPMLHLYAVHFTQPLTTVEFARLLRRVSPERRVLIGRYRFWQDAHRALLAELVARHCIQQALGYSWDSIIFDKTAMGKPFLRGAQDFHFNIAHSGEWVIFASACSPIGVDVERIQCLEPEVFSQILTPREMKACAAHSAADRLSFLFSLWTIKESYAKALGFGLQLHFRDLDVCIEDREHVLIKRFGEADPTMKVWRGYLDPDHPVAICGTWDQQHSSTIQLTKWEMEQFVHVLE